MSVCVCIASRGRPHQLKRTVTELYRSAVRPDTQIVAAIDDDDPTLAEYGPWGRGPRETSLGAKYNRAASYASSATTLYVLGVDDAYIVTKGWDHILLTTAAKFSDGVGVVYFGEKKHEICQLPDSMAVTRGWIDQVGFFMPPYFPFWWHDTWIDELARMTGRFVWTEEIQWEKHGESEVGGHKTTRMREVAWWAKFFDATRELRIRKAFDMIERLDYPEYYRSQLQQEIGSVAYNVWKRGELVREHPDIFEGRFGAADGYDPGYLDIKAKAQQMIGQLTGWSADPDAGKAKIA